LIFRKAHKGPLNHRGKEKEKEKKKKPFQNLSGSERAAKQNKTKQNKTKQKVSVSPALLLSYSPTFPAP
jgi:hypothetical protein